MTTDTISATDAISATDDAAKPTRARRQVTTAKPDATIVKPTATPMLDKPTPGATVKPTTKSDTVIKLLLRAKGATPTELIAATDWLPHSLRAFLTGLRKKGRVIVREANKSGGFAYRIVVESAPGGKADKPDEGDNGSSTGAGERESRVGDDANATAEA